MVQLRQNRSSNTKQDQLMGWRREARMPVIQGQGPRLPGIVSWKVNDPGAGSNIKLHPHEMLKLNETSLKMKDGLGSLAVLGVYHELHCVKRLRKWFYRECYYPNQTDLEFNQRMTHAEHCLQFLRQAAMCHGDIAVTSFKWLHDAEGHVIETTTKEGALHRCVKWDNLRAWARSRRVDLFDPNLLDSEHVDPGDWP
ncbi:hypothetical protein MMYC01_209346 [Madurella mycetomatis]|uniref:Uncharacterized protein n=1 Tax=Madurella mycetomatis TaxID=100816 RepID=A0A175VT23_9PEZI|nr:hypothetical protein MMYC01_209346 [Madurella mycetomatis]